MNMKKLLLTICCACLLYGGYSIVFAAEPVYREYTVVVGRGDTLWDIAGRHVEPQEDIREVMFRISQANNLQNKTLQPGQVLKVPLRVQDSGLMIANK